jgi:predicted outer membrane repeat protein
MCLTEHRENNQKLKCINIIDFNSVSAFCRNCSEHGGSGIYVKDDLETKEISYFAGKSEEKFLKCH